MKTKLTWLKIEFIIQSILLILNAVFLILLISVDLKYAFYFFLITQISLSLFQYFISVPMHYLFNEKIDKIRSWRIALFVLGVVNMFFLITLKVGNFQLSKAFLLTAFLLPLLFSSVYYFLTYKHIRGIKSIIAHQHILNTKF